jgi:hypothetical protein
MTTFDPANYSSPIADLLHEKRLMPLGPGSPNLLMKPKLEALDLEAAFMPRRIRDADMAKACLASLWLYHDFLDESHVISQSLETTTGSYWHGIMHRREFDFDNAPYWFRRVGEHPIFAPLAMAAAMLASATKLDKTASFLRTQKTWDALAFIDACESCQRGSSTLEMLYRQIQQREWEFLFDYCYRQAVGLPMQES